MRRATDPWVYRLVFSLAGGGAIPHPGHALHRTLQSVGRHAQVLQREGVRTVSLEHWENGDWWPVEIQRGRS